MIRTQCRARPTLPRVSRIAIPSRNAVPGNHPPPAAAAAATHGHAKRGLDARDGRQVALASGVAIAAAVAAGLDDPAHLGVLAASSCAAAAGAFLLGHRSRAAPGVALVAASLVAVPWLGLGPPLFLLAGALTYALVYARWLAPRTPFAIVVAGAAAACLAPAGWLAGASSLRPTPLLLAAVIFLWVPGHAWSYSLATECVPGTPGVPLLRAAAGPARTAAAVFATTVAVVVASLVLAPGLAWPYAAVAVPAGACLLAAAHALRRRADPGSARRAFELSGLYLSALLGALVLAST